MENHPGVRVKLVILGNATAKFFKPRPVLYAIRGTIPGTIGEFGIHLIQLFRQCNAYDFIYMNFICTMTSLSAPFQMNVCIC